MLKDITDIKVRFSEVDSMGILWHGHYIKYFEDGRESFGRSFEFGYMNIYHNHDFVYTLLLNYSIITLIAFIV